MILGGLEVELRLFAVDNLKAKRRILKGLLERLRRTYGVAAAEVARQEDHRRATLGLAYVGGEVFHVRLVLEQALRTIEDTDYLEVLEHRLELVG